jgi:large subunit ribosomal protein L18
MKENIRIAMRKVRQQRVRKKIAGTESMPRLAVYRSTRHMYAQVINDDTGRTICAASTLSPDLAEELKDLDKKKQAEVVGKKIAELCIKSGLDKVVFDRGGFLYHGRIASLAKGARSGGLVL